MAIKRTYYREVGIEFDIIDVDPDSKKDYSNDWSDWLADSGGDSLSSSFWVSNPSLVIHATPPATNSITTSTVWLGVAAGVSIGALIPVVNRVVTAGGRTEDETFYLRVKAK